MRSWTDKELRTIALDLALGYVYTSLQVEDHLLPLVFMPLALLSKEGVEEIDALPREQQPGIFFEYIDKAGPRNINGHPIFWSVQWVGIGQVEEFQELYKTSLKRVQDLKKGE